MNTLKFLWVIILIGLSLCVCAQNVTSNEEAFDQAINQLKDDNVDEVTRNKAINTLRMLADKGYGKALNQMGVFYAEGSMPGIAQDGQKAKEYFTKAWNAKEHIAARNMHSLYINGVCCPPDTVMAIEWLKKGAEAGDAVSMYKLGVYYWEPYGGQEPDSINAIGWFRKAADLNNGDAMLALSRFYYFKKNYEEERYWLKRGAESNDGNCLWIYGLHLQDGTSGIEKDEEKAAECFKKAADLHGLSYAEMSYANICDAKADYTTALQYYERSAKKGNFFSIIMTADYYMHGRGNAIAKNEALAFDWYSRGASTLPSSEKEQYMCEICRARVGLCYYLGMGVDKDCARGSDILHKQAGQGNETAKQYIKDYNVK